MQFLPTCFENLEETDNFQNTLSKLSQETVKKKTNTNWKRPKPQAENNYMYKDSKKENLSFK